MTRIKVLPNIIVNQIAAGEVVERPSAVVKELVENSIDSGARNIIVRFSHGGKYSIIVEDDGCGMSQEDANLAFERHATSKISTVEDINDIQTFGFRGEALPSIASVSLFTMYTRTSGSKAGTEIVFNGGKLIHCKECGTTPGTVIKVEQLFHNTPARRLFLKTDQTESNLIINLVKNFALAERGVKFELYSETKKIFTSPTSQEWPDRINEVFFDKECLLPVLFENRDCKIEGAICDPNNGNPCRKFLSFFVNRRPIDSKLLRIAVSDALSPILPKHREIIACLLVTINPRFIDVNVHPTKREIRFRNEQFVRSCVIDAINEALQKNVQFTTNILNNLHGQTLPKYTTTSATNSKIIPQAIMAHPQEIHHKQIFHETKKIFQKNAEPSITAHWKFAGTLFQNCVIFEHDSGMVILNMQLAVMKIVYEKLRKESQAKNIQTLLFPIDFDVSAEESEILNNILEFLTKEGLEIYTFGQNQYRISGIPDWLSGTEAEKLVKDLISSHSESDTIKDLSANRKEFAIRASKYVKYEPISEIKDIQVLLDELLMCENCALSPNGYSTFFEIPKCDFIKRFGRL